MGRQTGAMAYSMKRYLETHGKTVISGNEIGKGCSHISSRKAQ